MNLLDLQTFAASNLVDSGGLTAAFGMLESCLAGPDIHLDLIVQELCSIPNLFEFVVSALPGRKRLVHRILSTYSTDPALAEASSRNLLLRRLSSVIFFLPPYLFPTDTTRRIGWYKKYVEDALPLLALLRSAKFLACITTDATSMSPLEVLENDNGGVPEATVHSKQYTNSRHKNKSDVPLLDISLFRRLDYKVPLNSTEASKVTHEITNELRGILKFYLELLLDPSLAQQFRDAYIPTPSEDPTVHPPMPREAPVVEAVEPDSAYPAVQPLKAALHFKNADGFGEWRVVIGTDATKKLRELARADQKKCAIVLKKIKQLSKGHFSKENQKRLNGSSGIPIFEAKMQRDLRLVYQIDVILDHDGEVDRQVIKIYGIYTHTQMDRIWDAIGHQVTRKGKEYHRRCIFRNRPVDAGGDVYLPASFPPEDPGSDEGRIPFVLSDDEMGELHSLLVLGKYATFSQAYLHSLIVDRDVHHVFELTPLERKIVDCTTSCYVLGRSGTGKTTTMAYKMLGIQLSWELQASDLPKPRQIFVTKSCVLANKVGEYFTDLLETLALAGCSRDELRRIRPRNAESELLPRADGIVQGTCIPQSYSELEEKHFPLFVTFDKLANMIAKDVLSGGGPEIQHIAKIFTGTDGIKTESFVTYDVFAESYWPHLPQTLTKGLDPWLVFSEFMGVIKGSEKSLSCPDGFLDEEEYCDLSTRTNPTFANQRRMLYATFEAYCKIKRERYHYDVADRTHAILTALLGGVPLRGQKVDFLYIDEAQDNLLIDALLLRLICRNPEGLFWAGDTAQTISAGSSFRFNDLKAFLYRIEQDQSAYLIQDRSVNDPTNFQLAVNYRSHGGIVNCAHSVIERITYFWPDAIDIIQREHGTVDGPKPVFFRGWDQDAPYEQFLFGTPESGIDFGAEQCILVRDDQALEKLRNEIGEVGLIMTLYDSKGLEFNDVLLYNFFEDSAVDVSRWRVLLNHADGEVDGKRLAEMCVPSFERDRDRYAGVCSELKLLYVGITRARKNLWIFDKSDKSEPMQMIWNSRNQLDNCRSRTDVPHLARSSTPAEWELFGRYLFTNEKYSQAKQCFDRALQPRWAAICEAFRLQQAARAKAGSGKAQQDAFLAAANAFMESGKDAPPGNAKFEYYRYAAKCYVRARKYRGAALGFFSAQDYEWAAWYFREAGLFNEVLKVLHEHSQKIPSKSREKLYTLCRLHFYNKHDDEGSCLPLFTSVEEELKFLEEHGFDRDRAALLETLGRFLEAARIHSEGDRPLDAIKDLLMERECRGDAIRRGIRILLDNLWRRCSFGTSHKEIAANRVFSELLDLALQFPFDLIDPLDRDEISMFRAIMQEDLTSLEELSHVLVKGNRDMPALLALDHFFGHFPSSKPYTLLQMSHFLDTFQEYVHLLKRVISHDNPLNNPSIKRSFAISERPNGDYGMEPGTFLHRSVAGDPRGAMHRQSFSKKEMVGELRKHLVERLREYVTKEIGLCHNALPSPCLVFMVNRRCDWDGCAQEHIGSASLDTRQLNVRIDMHLQQIRILDLTYSVDPRLSEWNRILDWITRFYVAINPKSYLHGSISDPNPSQFAIREANKSVLVVKRLVRSALYALRKNPGNGILLTTVLNLTRLLFESDKRNAFEFIKKAHLDTRNSRVPESMHLDDCHVLDIIEFFDGTPNCILAGLSLLRHIVKSSLVPDLSILCDYLEKVVSKMTISLNLSYDPPLDGFVVPRGWLSSNIGFALEPTVDTDINRLVDVLSDVKELLIRLQSDPATRLHSNLTPVLCDIFTSRICRTLCFLAFNARDSKVEQKVSDIFNGLQTANSESQEVHLLYQKYAHAHRQEYLEIMVDHDAHSKTVIMDLVQLLNKGVPCPTSPLRLPGIRHIYFANPTEIPRLLTSRYRKARSGLSGNAPALIHRDDRMSQTEPAAQNTQTLEPELDPVDDLLEEPSELASAQDDPEPKLITERELVGEEIRAAKTILATYCRYRRRRETSTHDFGEGFKTERNAVFIACLKNVYNFRWGRSPYRTLYLWALPHLVMCLDKAIVLVHKSKKKTTSRLSELSHEHLEETWEKLNKITALLKDGHKLRKKIEPNATMHQEKNEVAMKEVVLDVEAFLDRLPSGSPAAEIRKDFAKAHQLIVLKKQRGTKPEKPMLNTEDLLELGY